MTRFRRGRRRSPWLVAAAGLAWAAAAAGEEDKICVVDGRLSVADAVEGCRPGDVVAGSFAGGVGAEGPAAAYAARICDFARQVVLQPPLPAGLHSVQGGDVALACVYLGRVRDERATK
jgi:hypothetical protein